MAWAAARVSHWRPDGSPSPSKLFPDHSQSPWEKSRPTGPFPGPAGAHHHPPGEDSGAQADTKAGLAPAPPARAAQGETGRELAGRPPPRRFRPVGGCSWPAEALDKRTGPAPGQRRGRRPGKAWSTVSMVKAGPWWRRRSRTRRQLFTIDVGRQASIAPMRKPAQGLGLAQGRESGRLRTTASDESQRVIEETPGRRRPIAPLVARSSSARSTGCGRNRPPGAIQLRQVLTVNMVPAPECSDRSAQGQPPALGRPPSRRASACLPRPANGSATENWAGARWLERIATMIPRRVQPVDRFPTKLLKPVRPDNAF